MENAESKDSHGGVHVILRTSPSVSSPCKPSPEWCGQRLVPRPLQLFSLRIALPSVTRPTPSVRMECAGFVRADVPNLQNCRGQATDSPRDFHRFRRKCALVFLIIWATTCTASMLCKRAAFILAITPACKKLPVCWVSMSAHLDVTLRDIGSRQASLTTQTARGVSHSLHENAVQQTVQRKTCCRDLDTTIVLRAPQQREKSALNTSSTASYSADSMTAKSSSRIGCQDFLATHKGS